MADGQTHSNSLAKELRNRISPQASYLLAELQDNPQWVEILLVLKDVRVRPWTPKDKDVTSWAYDTGVVDGFNKAAQALYGKNFSQE